MGTVLLLDGNSLVFRAFFAIPDDMVTSKGVVTNAAYGFTAMLVNLIRDHRPEGMAVAFDRAEPTFRHEMVDDYKAGRAETPDILFPQFDMVKSLLAALGIAVGEVPGFEADDVIATLARHAEAHGYDVIIVSGDRDTFQLVRDPHVRVLYNKRGVTDYDLYDEAGIKARCGVPPSDYVTFAALRGDPSDNLPGVPGVGEKTAAKLITTYGDLDGIYAHLAELTPKLRENLAAYEGQVRSNMAMMPLVDDIDIKMGEEAGALRLGKWDESALRDVFDALEFRGLRRRLAEVIGLPGLADGEHANPGGAPSGHGEERGGSEVPASTGRAAEQASAAGAAARSTSSGDVTGAGQDAAMPSSAREAASVLRDLGEVAHRIGLQVTWEGDPGRSEISGMALVGEGVEGAPAGSIWIPGRVLASAAGARAVNQLFSGDTRVVAHRAKEMMRSLFPLGIDILSLSMDVGVAAYLLDPVSGRYELDALIATYLPEPGEPGVVGAIPPLDPAAHSPGISHAITEAELVLRLATVLGVSLAATGMHDLYEEVENPLVRVLAQMETIGIAVDATRLRNVISDLATEAGTLNGEIQALAGEPFLVNSTKQLREILYTKLGLAPSRKTKTGYSTDAASLEKLRDKHPIVEKLLRYREVEKLRSTYGAGLIDEIDPVDGRIHASFNQTVARTGRLSSDRPNLHNIPVRSEDGRRIREAFIPGEGNRFLIADYNQIELRIIAHLSGDTGLLEAFSSLIDIHTATASRIFGVKADAVTMAQRSKAKMVSYGLAYGMEAFGLAGRLGIAVEEAARILDAFFASFPGVKSYMERSVQEARERGYSVTEMGRRRPIPELGSFNRQVRMAAERQAMNAAVQGLAADIFKLALVRLARDLESAKAGSRIVLQVHDEVVVEVASAEERVAEEICRRTMENAYELKVPLAVEVAWGDSWAAK